MKQEKTKTCKATIKFGDDFGDNVCTFHCELPKGHKGPHKEEGDLWEKHYIVIWYTKETKNES